MAFPLWLLMGLQINAEMYFTDFLWVCVLPKPDTGCIPTFTQFEKDMSDHLVSALLSAINLSHSLKTMRRPLKTPFILTC